MEANMRYISILLLAVLTGLASAAFAQTDRAMGTSPTVRLTTSQPTTSQPQPMGVPFTCDPCLWYSGDFDVNVGADLLWNANATWEDRTGQVYVPFIAEPNGTADKHVAISSITFVEAVPIYPINDFGGGTYTLLQGMSAGNSGTTLKTGDCDMGAANTGISYGTFQLINFDCLFEKPIKVTIGELYWVNILPIFTANNYAYLLPVNDLPGANQMGWGDIYYNSFWSFPADSINLQPASAYDFYEPVIAIGGTYVP
jgi:uncharacterized membrane protein